MNPARFFAVQTYKVSHQGVSGGLPTLTPSMAAHYCQGMAEHIYLSALLRWADNWSGTRDLEYRLWDEAVKLKNRERWRIERKHEGQEMLRKLAGLALWEMGDPAKFQAQDSWKRRADWLGVDKAAWFRTWRPRYEAVYGILNEWSMDAWRHISKQLAKDEIEA